MDQKDIAKRIILMERSALDRWGAGDPSGFLEICDPDVVYFDPFLEERKDGLPALSSYYESIRGRVHIDRDQMINPKVQVNGEVAVLTFNYVSKMEEIEMRWNCTEVYACRSDQWRIIQTHWSITQHLSPV